MNVPTIQTLPVGSVIGYYQKFDSKINQWLPVKPDGFYELTESPQKMPIIATNQFSRDFNFVLAYMLLRLENKLDKPYLTTFTLPPMKPIYFEKKNQVDPDIRIIFLIKHNFYAFAPKS